MKLPSTFLIQDTDFNNAWFKSIRYIINNGIDLTIGDASEPKPIKDACILIGLTGNAIKQIENHEIHPQYPFKYINEYCNEFTRSYQSEYEIKPADEKFSYTYFDRFTNYFNIDQLKYMKLNLEIQIKDNIFSNRNQIITWDQVNDIFDPSCPCLQNIWVRYLGSKQVEIHWHFRSHDLFSAWQSNIIAIIEMLNREVIKPNNCEIIKITEYNDSLHIYKSDLNAASKVKPTPMNPQLNYR